MDKDMLEKEDQLYMVLGSVGAGRTHHPDQYCCQTMEESRTVRVKDLGTTPLITEKEDQLYLTRPEFIINQKGQVEWTGKIDYLPIQVCPFCSFSVGAVITAAGAAERWGIGAATVKHACSGQHGKPPRFTDKECRKSKGVWFVITAGMKRLWGRIPGLKEYAEERQKMQKEKAELLKEKEEEEAYQEVYRIFLSSPDEKERLLAREYYLKQGEKDKEKWNKKNEIELQNARDFLKNMIQK